MKKTILSLFAALSILFVSATTNTAKADNLNTGLITSIAKLQANSDEASYYSGVITINSVLYYWGGSTCSNFTAGPTTTDVQMMSEAAVNGKTVTIFWKYQGSNRCYVAMRVNY